MTAATATRPQVFPSFDAALARFGLGGHASDSRNVHRGYCATCGVAWVWWSKQPFERFCPAARCLSRGQFLRRTSHLKRPRNGWRWWPGVSDA